MKKRRYVLLDRDGTINVERNYLSHPDDVELLPKTLAGLQQMQRMQLGLAVVTNQSGLSRGYFDAAMLDRIHQRLAQLLAAGNVTLDGIFTCPHVPEDGCSCRKPEPGLVWQAAQALHFDPSQAFMIGDKACDVDLGRRIGAVTLLVRTGYGSQLDAADLVKPDFVAADLLEVAQIIADLQKNSA